MFGERDEGRKDPLLSRLEAEIDAKVRILQWGKRLDTIC